MDPTHTQTESGAPSTPDSVTFTQLFNLQYIQFADELEEAFPELEPQLKLALALSEEDRIRKFAEEVLPSMAAVHGSDKEPNCLLPGVKLPAGAWSALSETNRKSILSYLGLLSSCALFNIDGSKVDGENKSSGGIPFDTGSASWKGAMNWYESMMGQWKDKASGVDWSAMTSKISSIFGISGEGFKLPEKFMKGHLARLVEELMRDFNPADFGFSEEDIKKLESSAGGDGGMNGAFEMLMNVYNKNPDFIQKIVERVGNRLKQKIMSGSINPKQIAQEAEEMMKDFTDNPEFKSLLETIKGMFGFEDMDLARAAGREGSARLAATRDHLRKKLEKKKAATTPAAAAGAGAGVDSTFSMSSIEEILKAVNGIGAPAGSKKNKKK